MLASRAATGDSEYGGFLAQALLRGFKGYGWPAATRKTDGGEMALISLQSAYNYAYSEMRCRSSQGNPIFSGNNTGIIVHTRVNFCLGLDEILYEYYPRRTTHRATTDLDFLVCFTDVALAAWIEPEVVLVWSIDGSPDFPVVMEEQAGPFAGVFSAKIEARYLNQGTLTYRYLIEGRAACLDLRTEACPKTIRIRR